MHSLWFILNLVTLNLNLLIFLEQNAWLQTSTSNLKWITLIMLLLEYHIDIESLNLMM